MQGEHLEGPLKGKIAVNIRALRGIDPFDIEYVKIYCSAGVDHC